MEKRNIVLLYFNPYRVVLIYNTNKNQKKEANIVKFNTIISTN